VEIKTTLKMPEKLTTSFSSSSSRASWTNPSDRLCCD
jgi:hypothetical protein